MFVEQMLVLMDEFIYNNQWTKVFNSNIVSEYFSITILFSIIDLMSVSNKKIYS